MTELKIGVLTFHRCINYGSYWQARCLVEALQARGHHAVLLDHQSRRINFAEWRCAYQPVLPTAVPPSDYPLYREKIERFFHAFTTLPLSPRFDLEQPYEMETCDVVVVGSDEIWNLSHPWYGGCPLFFGDGLRTERLIAYAATFGNYPATWGLDRTWAEKLQNFDSISVRDTNAQQLIEQSLDLDAALVLDPCLLHPATMHDPHSNFFEAPYVAVYGHNFSNAFARELRRWAAHRKLPLVSIGYRNDWADAQWLTAGPHEFACCMSNAEAVATNFFHGCVFALRNAKPFVCETTPYRTIKVQNLLEQLGAEAHLVTEDTPASLYNICLQEPLQTDILQNIERLRRSSNLYLDQALHVDQLQVA